ncbi:hypothetical protein [uncultured Alistipes sp.]|uniref:hypothetical protein n=1 Tax=uncultured Alistipes sp. TaxID=538949 RepID=UPI00262AC37D|nr:hypothetical protein [uncultured Alistipes sp.]
MAESAKAGDEVPLSIVPAEGMEIVTVHYNEEPCTFVSSDAETNTFNYTFTMPAHDVSLDVTTATEYNDITLEGDNHAYINMLNALVKDDNGDPVLDEDGNKMYRGFYNQVVQFTYEVDLGYNYSVTIVGKRTGTHYEDQTIFEDNGWDFNSYWTLVMPAELLTMTIKSSEKNDFVGKALVGNYKGFFINTTQLGKLERYDATTLEAEIKSNTAFSVKTTDANKFDFQGMISYDESTKQFAYDAASCEFYGLSGRYDDEMTVAWVSNLLEDMPDNVRFYIMSKNDLSSFISAGNAGGSKYLLEVKTSTGTAYYLFEREGYQLTKVDMEFTNGESLGDASATGFVMKEGEKLLQYTYDGSTTNLIEKGKEAGSYKPASGSGDELVLDGFGGGKIGTKEGTYTISDGIVTLTCDGQETKYNIDMNAKTYSPIADEGEWNGPTDFYVEGSQLAHDGGKDVKGCIKISIDKNAIGNPDKGKAYFVAQYWSSSYKFEDVLSALVTYVYDPSAKTLTLSQIGAGTADGGYGRIDIVLSVSDDKRTLTFTGIDRIYAQFNGSRYVTVTDLAVPAQE